MVEFEVAPNTKDALPLLTGSDDQFEALFQFPFTLPVQVWAQTPPTNARAVATASAIRVIIDRAQSGMIVEADVTKSADKALGTTQRQV
jgi:hypothetical protein